MKIDHITDSDGEPRRRMFMLVEITFRDRPREERPSTNYYDDDDLASVTADWLRSGVYDRDDAPRMRLMALPPVLDVDIESVMRGDYPDYETERF